MVLTLRFSKKAKSVTATSLDLSRQGEGPERFASSSLAQAYILHGRVEDARCILEKQIDEASRGHVLAANIAFIYGGLGETGKAFEWLEKSFDRGENSIMFQVRTARPFFQKLDPARYGALVKRMNLPSH